ncbi:MAG: hypothetical protein FWH12_02975 [Treponema sp.]|nr:hypothetical protein [Treponema sp.]
MKHTLWLLLISLSLSPALPAMDWPSSTGSVLRNFGYNDQGLPHLGMSFRDQGPLGAAENGELLFQNHSAGGASRLPSPLGAWLALDHGDGIISIYSRYEYDPSLVVPYRIERGRTLGVSGLSGWTGEGGHYFQLFDRRERRWINPSMIIQSMEDIRQPVIVQVLLSDSQGRVFDLSEVRSLEQGRYLLMVEAFDTLRLANEAPLAPYRIICYLNGSEAALLSFETFAARDGTLMAFRNGLVPVRQVFAPAPAYEVADLWFSRGQTSIEIIAQDIAGNSRNIIYRFTVE